MSCNCNSASKTCDPCMFCTPPGVTGLTTCEPPSCEKPIDINCVTYAGEDFECINVATGDTLIEVLLNILQTYFPIEECCKLEATVAVYTTTTSTSTTSTSTTSTSTTSTSTTAGPSITCNCYRLTNNTEITRPYSIRDCSTLAVVPGTIKTGQTLFLCSRSDGFVYDPLLTVAPLGLCSTGACITTTSTSTTTTAPPCNCIFVQNTNGEFGTVNFIDCTGQPSEPIVISSNFNICGSNPTTPSANIVFYPTGENCKFGGCVTTFTISNSIASSTIDNVAPYFYAISGGNFPVGYGTTETITGTHLEYDGTIQVYITNNGAAGCLELSVNGIVVDTNPVPGFQISFQALVCPITTMQDEIKINLRPGPC